MDKFTCTECGLTKNTDKSGITVGYGYNENHDKICYPCCGELDRKHMENNPKTYLYLDEVKRQVTNWPGTLAFNVVSMSRGRHNIARTRIDVWFKDHTGQPWHGVQYGDMTEIVHCKKVKSL